MSDLRALFPPADYITGGASGGMDRIYVYNTSTHSASNGGRCCLFTVPAGSTWATFELWGGGSAGPGSCCCQQPAQAGGAGAYSRKTISVSGGDTYRICAAGSTCCSPSCCGTEGFPSYAQGESVAGGDSLNVCARGGPRSCGKCFALSNTQNYYGNTCVCGTGSNCGEDFGLPAISGSNRSMWCYSNSMHYIPQGPYYGGGIRGSIVFCQCNGSGCGYFNGYGASWPGGGGGGASTQGSYCWGGWGAGGLVIITYR